MQHGHDGIVFGWEVLEADNRDVVSSLGLPMFADAEKPQLQTEQQMQYDFGAYDQCLWHGGNGVRHFGLWAGGTGEGEAREGGKDSMGKCQVQDLSASRQVAAGDALFQEH